jgi:hypothetical protein
LNEAAYTGQRRLMAGGTSATRMAARRDSAGGTAPPPQLLDERRADPQESRDGAWRAEPLLRGAKNLLPKVKGVGFHAPRHRPLIAVCANDNRSRVITLEKLCRIKESIPFKLHHHPLFNIFRANVIALRNVGEPFTARERKICAD